jgi:hypothetical protein
VKGRASWNWSRSTRGPISPISSVFDALDRQALGFFDLWRTKDKMPVAEVEPDLGIFANPVFAQEVSVVPQAESTDVAPIAEPPSLGEIGVDPLQVHQGSVQTHDAQLDPR